VSIEDLFARERDAVETALRELFPAAGEWPDRLWKAMAHAVFAGGKRIRPVLARLSYRAA
jgi:geranylgeranyl pyrophosphate synthase